MVVFNGFSGGTPLCRPPDDIYPCTFNEESVVISDSGDTLTTVKDAIVNTHNDAVYENRIQIALGTPAPRSIQCTANGSVSGSTVSRVNDGHATITVDFGTMKKGMNVWFKQTINTPLDSLSSWVVGSLAAHCQDQIDSRLAGGQFAQYSSMNTANGTYVRNFSCWASDVNLTCIPANNPGIAITSQHVLVASHYPGSGDIHFVDEGNQTIIRSRTATTAVPGIADLSIVTLNAILPDEITPVSLAPANIESYLASPQWRVPVFASNQSKQCVIKDTNGWSGSLGSFQDPVNPAYGPFVSPTISGDSSSPVCAIVNGNLMLLTLWSVIFGQLSIGSLPSKVISAINAITSPTAGLTVTTTNLAGFPTYG